MPPATAKTFKQEAHALVDKLPDDATWRDLIYHVAVRQDIQEALADSEAGRVKSVEEVLKEFDWADEGQLD